MYLSNFTPEEFQRQSDEPYIKKRYSTNLLNDILTDPEARATVSDNFVQGLLAQGSKCLKTEFHLNWAMECLGYSFTLAPRKHFNTILNSIDIYGEWLLNPTTAPQFLQNHLGYYQREILGHFSLAFSQQKESLKQVDICSVILKIICEFINSQKLEQETWLCLLKLLFKMTEEVLNNIRIAELLSQQTSKTLLQVWLLSNTRDKQLWMDLDKMLYNYIDNPWVIASWANVVLGLTKRVLNLLYGNVDKQFRVKFHGHKSLNEAPEIFTPNLDNEQVLYFWYRLLRIFLSNKNYQNKSLDSRKELIIGINKVINQFLKVCDLDNESIKPKGPANKEPILCNQSPLSLQDYYKLLSSIFMNQPKINLSSSLQVSSLSPKNNPASVKDHLVARDRIPVPSISGILEFFGSWLFGVTRPNSFYTEQERAEAISMICKILARAKGPATKTDLEKFTTRIFYEIQKKNLKTCNDIIINFSDLPKTNIKIIELILENFSFLQFIIDTLNENHLEIETKRHCFEIFLIYSNISEIYLGQKLANNLASIFLIHLADRDENCLFLLTWTICSYVTCLDNDSGTINSLLRGLVNRLGSLEENSRTNYFALLNCIGMIPYLIDRSKPSIDVIKTNVKIMLSLIPHKGKSNEETVCRLLLCITDWIIAFPPVFFDQEIKSQMLKKLDYSKIYEKYTNFNDFLKELLLNAFNQPECIGLWSRKQDRNMRKDLFYTEYTVFSAEEMDNYVILHIKNHIGSYIWKITEVKDQVLKKPLHLQMTNINIETRENQNQNKNYTQVDTEECLGKDFSAFQGIKKYFDKQKQTQTDFKNNCKSKPVFYKNIKNRKIIETTETCIDSARFKIFRRFVSELGYLDFNTLNMIHPPNEASKSLFQKIDMQSIKPLVIFPVIYLPTPDAEESTYLSSSAYYSDEFQEFLKSFGTLITGQGEYPYFCKPHLLRFRSCLFKSHAFLRSVVVSTALCQHDIKITLSEILDKYKNIVIWNERHNDRHSNKTPSIFNNIELNKTYCIVLTPIGNGLINVNLKVPLEKQGPLMDKMIVTLKHLPKLLLFTIYNLQHDFITRYTAWRRRVHMIGECFANGFEEKQSNITDILFMNINDKDMK